MHLKIIFISLLLSFSAIADETENIDPWVERSFVIIKSDTNYEEVLAEAKLAEKNLSIKLKLRDLQPHPKTGLTLSKDICESEWGEYPCYFPRGRYDEGVYVSIEYSNGYKGFTEGLYIIIVANDQPDSMLINKALARAKTKYPDAYAKKTKVYYGCMH